VQSAQALGAVLAESNHTLVYGGGSTGMMGALADAALQSDGRVIGVIPQTLATVELMHDRVADMRIVSDIHQRKAVMHSLADAYVALPGGFGTMEELFESLCWGQLDFHQSPIAILNIQGVFDGLVQLLDEMLSQNFFRPEHRKLLTVTQSVEELHDWLQTIPSTHAPTSI